MTNNLEDIVSTLLSTSVRNVAKLHGDASYRTYYRATAEDGETYIVMQMPEGKQSVSEEITNFNGTHEELPFINISRFLKGCGLPVPTIIKQDHEHHILILEDLGDELLWNLVSEQGIRAQREWYSKAVDLLVEMQEITEKKRDQKCVAFQRSFDKTLFNWEFDHFLEYCIEARVNMKLSDTDMDVFKDETRSISKKIGSFPYCFTHRDYQSRNLLFKDGKLIMIDFQDALEGPQVYDLVSLLRDSYVKLPWELVAEMVSRYAQAKKLPKDDILKQFDLVTIQRKMKDAGRFVFIDRVKKNPKFLPNIPTSLGYVKEAFSRVPEYQRLFGALIKFVPEWD